MSLLSKVIQVENFRLLEQLETRRMIARYKSWNKKAVFTKTSIVPTSEIHFWIYTMLKHLISGHIKRNTDVFMSIELPVSIWKWIHGFVRKNWALLWCTPHPAPHTCVGALQCLWPAASSACWANFTMLLSEPQLPLNVLLSTFVS